MRRLMTIVMTMTVLMSTTGAGAQTDWRARECRYRGLDGRMTWSREEVQLTIRCVAPKFGVSTSIALAIADRESDFRAGAVNPSSGACGVFQNMPAYWAARARAVPDVYDPIDRSCLNGRSNVLASMQLARSVGWGPWGAT